MFVEFRLKIGDGFSVSEKRQSPHLTPRTVIGRNGSIQKKLAIRRPTLAILRSFGFEHELFIPGPIDRFFVEAKFPFRSELKTMCFPSGDQHGIRAVPGPDVNRVLTPRKTSYSQMSESIPLTSWS